jgi:ABC-2 type transport system ATP-binding protein
MAAIIVEKLSKDFGKIRAVDSLSFNVPNGKVFAILGPNGAGKTTTLRILACIISPSSGDAYVAGASITKQPRKIRMITGIVTENPALYERLTAEENLEFFARAYGVNDPLERKRRIRMMMEDFDLWERRNDRVGTFSKGMKQKLSFIRALIHQPQVILLDEPTSSLDPLSSHLVRDYMIKMKRDGKTVILSTHRLEDVEKVADMVMLMSKGRALAFGSPAQLIEESNSKKAEIEVKNFEKKFENVIESIATVKEVVSQAESYLIKIEVNDFNTDIPQIVRKLAIEGADILSVRGDSRNLEEVYLRLIGDSE